MRGVFDDDRELEPDQPRRDTELTLGGGTLLAIFFGLVAICAVCFGLGYSLGHRGAMQPLMAGSQPPPGASTSLPASGSQPKPLPSSQSAVPTPAEDTSASPQGSQAQGATPTANSPAPVAPGAVPAPAVTHAKVASEPAPAAVHPALVAASDSVSPEQEGTTPKGVKPSPAPNAQLTPAPKVQPALPQTGPLMVQVAAISNVDDARVLVDALRKRGFTVNAVREPADNLIHVRIGPFATRSEANAMSQKLLNDGYNAIVLP